MEFTYSKYAIAYPWLDDLASVPVDFRPGDQFLPDQLLDAMKEEVLPLAGGYWESYQKDVADEIHPPLFLPKRNRIVIGNPPITWEKSRAMAQETATLITPVAGQSVGRAITNNWIEAIGAKIGFSGGVCCSLNRSPASDGRPATIRLTYDGTVSDPVYLAHEAGHYFAHDRKSKSHWKDESSYTERAVAEMQAFFFQHVFYDPSLHPERSADLAEAIALHQKAETLNMLDAVKEGFSAWEKSRLVRGDDRFSKEGNAQLDRGYLLHARVHSAPYFISAGLWDRYKSMETKQQGCFLNVLYPDAALAPGTNGIPQLEKILSAVGVNSEERFRAFMRESVQAVLVASPILSPRLREQRSQNAVAKPA